MKKIFLFAFMSMMTIASFAGAKSEEKISYPMAASFYSGCVEEGATDASKKSQWEAYCVCATINIHQQVSHQEFMDFAGFAGSKEGEKAEDIFTKYPKIGGIITQCLSEITAK